MSAPFLIFPWDRPFLPHLQRAVVQRTDGNPGRAVIIVPHNRPRRYLQEYFCQDKSLARPLLLPRVLTVSEMIGLFRAQMTPRPLRLAQTLDRVALLYRCAQDVAEAAPEDMLCTRLAGMDMARFFPWGLRLAAVLEECLTQQLQAKDIPYVEGEVSPLAAALLGALGRIHARYMEVLEADGWTTPGLDAFRAASSVLSAPPLPPLLHCDASNGRQIFIAGLAVLSDAENTLLHHLWQHGAHICLHTDPLLAEGAEGTEAPGRGAAPTSHWACVDHVRWMRQWKAQGQLACPPSGQRPRWHFLAGYDVHSQLLAVRDVLGEQQDDAPSTAIVLSHADLLMPTLHHLPDRDFNVSMGYPLERAPLARLLEALLRLQASRRAGEGGEGSRYHWRALLQCLRHPYVQMLRTAAPADTAQGQELRPLLQRMEEALRGGARFASPEALLVEVEADFSPPLRQLARHTLNTLVQRMATVRTPAQMGEALSHICQLLLDHGGDTWERYPLDAESLYRMLRHVVPGLTGTSLADTPFAPTALFSLTRQLLKAERVPFEADPIAGLQILGMLETRLLHFERILVLDATEDHLPGFTAQDPLLPDALRGLLGLPDASHRERTAAHTLYRLMAAAKDVHFFWQEGIQRSALFDGKKSRSRFIDECIWRMEQERGTLLEPGQPPLRVAPCPVRPMPRTAQGLPADAALRGQLDELLQKGLSPTRLDSYILCPARFAWESLYKLRPAEEVNEGDDPAAVGELVHQVLQDAYTPWLNRPLRSGDIRLADLEERFSLTLESSGLREKLPPDSYILLSLAGPLRLAKYLENQPYFTRVLALEQKLTAKLPLPGEGSAFCCIKGTLDRVDSRLDEVSKDGRERLVVLDYKTGKVQRPAPTLWSDTLFWQDMQTVTFPSAGGDALLAQVAENFHSLQLPSYLHLCLHSAEMVKLGRAGDAAWVTLRENGAELPLLGEDVDESLRDTVLTERVPQLLGFVVRHMQNTPCFAPREGDHCRHCPYTTLCKK